MKIKPTVGRVVWFWPPVQPQAGIGNVLYLGQPFAATVAAVCDEDGRRINISYVDHEGNPWSRRAVELIQEGEAEPEGGIFCSWMPYQVGQAKKHAGEDAVAAGAASKPILGPATDHLEDAHQRGFREGYQRAQYDRLTDWKGKATRAANLSFPVQGYPFGMALEAAMRGCTIYRKGWNGKGMWVAYSPGSQALEAEKFWSPAARDYAVMSGGRVPVLPCLIMKTADGQIQMGWLASQTDMLAGDWVIEPIPHDQRATTDESAPAGA